MSAVVAALRPAAMDPCLDPSPIVIRVTGLSVRFGELVALEAMSLAIRNGEFVALLGPSGCGKSTLLKAIAGLVPCAQGRIDIAPAALRLGVMFQKPLLLPWRTTIGNVLLPLELQLGDRAVTAAHRRRALDMLELVRLRDSADAYPHQLSGGMQQRAALARTLMSDPDLLLLDEPFGALDELTRERLNEELIGIWRSGATRLKTVIMVTHSVPEAVGMSDRVFVLAARPARVIDIVEVPLDYPRPPESGPVVALVKQTRELVRATL